MSDEQYRALVAVDARLDAYKASFGGDRSAAGRYAAEQRWKDHVKRQDRDYARRTVDEQLAQGPKTLAFGRDAKGLPIVGTQKQLEDKFGKTDKERVAYFKKKYGVIVKFTHDEKKGENRDAIQVKLGALQALDDILSNLRVMPTGFSTKPPISEIQIGNKNYYDSPWSSGAPPEAFVRTSAKDGRGFLLFLDTNRIAQAGYDMVAKAQPMTQENSDDEGYESPLDETNLRREEEAAHQSIAPRFGVAGYKLSPTATIEDASTVTRRMAYAVMVHEFGHVLDTPSFFSSRKDDTGNNTSTRLEEATTPKGVAWRKTKPVSEYAGQNEWEKMAEGFAAWFLFSQAVGRVSAYAPKTDEWKYEASDWLKNTTRRDMKRLIGPTVRPLLEALTPPQTAEQVLKQVADFVTTIADLRADHPIIVFAMAASSDVEKMKTTVRRDAMIAAALAKASFGGDRSAAGRYAAEQRWKGHVKQSSESHDGSSSKKLSVDELKDILGSSANAVKAHEAIAKRLGKTMKPKVEDLSDDDINAWRAVSDNGAKRLIQGKIKNAEWATYGQGLYVMMAGQKGEGMTEEYAKDHALRYGKNLIGLRLGESAKIVDGATRSSSVEAAEVRREIEKREFHSTVHYSHEDFHNLYWASQGFDGWQPSGRQKGGEVLLFNAEHLSVNKADLPPKIANLKVKKSLIRRDAMIAAALAKASFGGDRSAAGRYAAEQRWKDHVKRQRGRSQGRSVDQQLKEGPQNLAFGRDANGLVRVGTIEELRQRYGTTVQEHQKYFMDKYGFAPDLGAAKGGREGAVLGALQALDDVLSNLTSVPSGLTTPRDPKDAERQQQYEKDFARYGGVLASPMVAKVSIGADVVTGLSIFSGWMGYGISGKARLEHLPNDPLAFQVHINPQAVSSAVDQFLNPKKDKYPVWGTTGYMFESVFSAEEKARMASDPILRQRAESVVAYAVMVHELGHMLDFGGTFGLGTTDRKTGAEYPYLSDRFLAQNSEWQNTMQVSGYAQNNAHEKQAEAFTVWFTGIKDAIGEHFGDIRRDAATTMKPLLESLRPPLVSSQVIKMWNDTGIRVEELPPDHPIILFFVQQMQSAEMQKTRVRVDAMVDAALEKASFGGDRSAAGRYAAEQRWKDHVKQIKLPKPTGFLGNTTDKRTGEPFASSMGGQDAFSMVEDDLIALRLHEEKIKDPIRNPSTVGFGDIGDTDNRHACKRRITRDLTDGVMATMKPKELVGALRVFWKESVQDDGPDSYWKSLEQPHLLRAAVEKMVSETVHSWAISSNDNYPMSLATQLVVQRLFGLKDTAPSSVTDASDEANGKAEKLADPKGAYGKFLEAVVLQQYANTQAYFAAKGITEVTLHRGKNDANLAARLNKEESAQGKVDLNIKMNSNYSYSAQVVLRPLSAFSFSSLTADDFATMDSTVRLENSVRITVRIPVSQVFSTPFTGIGCLPETEFVVLGKPTTAVIGRPNSGR